MKYLSVLIILLNLIAFSCSTDYYYNYHLATVASNSNDSSSIVIDSFEVKIIDRPSCSVTYTSDTFEPDSQVATLWFYNYDSKDELLADNFQLQVLYSFNEKKWDTTIFFSDLYSITGDNYRMNSYPHYSSWLSLYIDTSNIR